MTSDDGVREELRSRVQQVIDTTILPALAGDGGGVSIADIIGHEVYISYSGACAHCPMALTGTLAFIQQALKASVDERIVVRPVLPPLEAMDLSMGRGMCTEEA